MRGPKPFARAPGDGQRQRARFMGRSSERRRFGAASILNHHRGPTIGMVAPAVALSSIRLLPNDVMVEPLYMAIPSTLPVTNEEPIRTVAVAPSALRPMPLFAETDRSMCMVTTAPPGGVKAVIPAKIFSVAALSEMETEIGLVVKVPSARMPKALFTAFTRTKLALALPPAVGWMKIPPPVALVPLLATTESDTKSEDAPEGVN